MTPTMRALLLVFTTLSFVVLPAATQENQDAVFIDRVDVNVVNVEVFVTDRQGQRVQGLNVDDFEIYEDGRLVEISNFYRVARENRVERNLERDRALVQGTPPPLDLLPLPEDQKLNLLVYVDNFNLKPNTRNKALKDMEGFLEDRLSQGDNVMLVAFNRKIDVIQGFTTDRQKILRGIQKIRKMSGTRALNEASRRNILRDIEFYTSSSANAGDTFSAAVDSVRSYVQQAQEDFEQSAVGLRDVTRSLAGLPGRKAILYVADGLTELPGQDIYEFLVQSYSRGASSRGQKVDRPLEIYDNYRPDIFRNIVTDANAHQVTFYTLNAQGHFGDSLLSAENETLGATGGGLADIETIKNANLQAPMVHLAERTGGTAIRNTTNFDGALNNVSQDFDIFYSLGYRSPRGGDSKYHTIDVKVRRPGLKARHRSGYVDKPQAERVADRTLSSLLLEVEKNPLGIGIDFGPPHKKSRKEFILPVIIRIPVRDLAFLPQGGTEQGRLTIFVAARSEDGAISAMQQLPLPLKFPTETLGKSRTSEIAYRTNLSLAPGTPTIAVGVWDELSGTESFVHKKILLDKKANQRVASSGR
jgi:VWFA-related protein